MLGSGDMKDKKEKIKLTKERETLLIPLYCKAVEAMRKNPIIIDEKAKEILGRIEYDFAQLRVPRKTAVTLCMRAGKIDAYTREFLANSPNSVVLHLGCGLDSRYLRVDDGKVEWYDLDFPDVIDLRKKFYKETANYHMISSSVTDLSWINTISTQGRDVFVVAEGLFMYLKEEEVKLLIIRLKESFPGCGLVFDAYSVLTAKQVKKHPSVKRTGAVVQWGIDDPKDIEKWAKGINLKEEWYFTQSEDIAKLGLGYRLLFGIAGLFSAANRAHRVLCYKL
jgi:O-methyltransferase involved in polyketide biosynthesis